MKIQRKEDVTPPPVTVKSEGDDTIDPPSKKQKVEHKKIRGQNKVYLLNSKSSILLQEIYFF